MIIETYIRINVCWSCWNVPVVHWMNLTFYLCSSFWYITVKNKAWVFMHCILFLKSLFNTLLPPLSIALVFPTSFDILCLHFYLIQMFYKFSVYSTLISGLFRSILLNFQIYLNKFKFQICFLFQMSLFHWFLP